PGHGRRRPAGPVRRPGRLLPPRRSHRHRRGSSRHDRALRGRGRRPGQRGPAAALASRGPRTPGPDPQAGGDMTTDTLTLDTPAGPMDLFEARPDGDARAAVIVIQEAFGVNEYVQAVAQN